MLYPDFGLCGPRAVKFAHELKSWGNEPEVFYGLFIARKPKVLWDERWHAANTDTFSHFWLYVDDRFIDISARQFGEKGFVIAKVNDKRYQPCGKINLKTGEWIPTNSLQILWNTLNFNEFGIPTMRVLEELRGQASGAS